MMQSNKSPKIIGLTGGSGSGKSTIGSAAPDSILYIDADKLGQQILLKGKPAYNELTQLFGDVILGDDGEIDRKKLGAIVFSNSEKLKLLNSVSHRYIMEETQRLVDSTDKQGVIVDGAVIIGSIMQDMCDVIVSVLADKETRIERIIARDGITREMAEKRIANQPDDKFYVANSDYIIYNNKDTQGVIKEATEIFRRIMV